jgi:transposase
MNDRERTRTELIQACSAAPEQVADLVLKLFDRVDMLEARIVDLEARLNQDSHNNSKPPSSDTTKNYTNDSKKKSSRSSGGQHGHEGSTLKRVATPDQVILHSVDECTHCGHSLLTVKAQSIKKRQVIDVPPITPVVTEHQAESKSCPHCGVVSQAQFPSAVTKAVQYGETIKAIASYLMQYQLIPAARTREFLNDILGCPVSEGSLVAWSEHLAELSAPAYTEIQNVVAASSVIHTDETGVNCDKKNYWFHVVTTQAATLLSVHPKRGKDVMDAIGVLPNFKGTAVHDMWASYFRYKDIRHAVCNAHLLRELTFALEEFKQRWAGKLITLLCHIHAVVERRRSSGIAQLDERTMKRNQDRYDHLVALGLRKNPRHRGSPHMRGRVKQSKVRNLLERLRDHADAVLLFMYVFTVPFTNNLAERDLRMSKVKMKISGCFRSPAAAEVYCRIRSYISTVSKQGLNIFHAIVSAFNGRPIIPKNIYAE